jgi:hypothetical protein
VLWTHPGVDAGEPRRHGDAVSEAEPLVGRWERLFADLDAEAEATDRSELTEEVLDRSRAEATSIHLLDRLRAAENAALDVRVCGVGRFTGVVRSAGPGWLLLHDGGEVLVNLAAVVGITGLTRQVMAPEVAGQVAARIDLRHLLRRLARERAPLRVFLTDGSEVGGTLDRVCADHVDLAEHDLHEARRSGSVRGFRTIPLSAFAAVRGR